MYYYRIFDEDTEEEIEGLLELDAMWLIDDGPYVSGSRIYAVKSIRLSYETLEEGKPVYYVTVSDITPH